VKLAIDPEACVGARACVMAAPDTFDQDDNGLVVLVGDGNADDQAMRDAVRDCPSGALRLGAAS
jgi:ferredoxin